MADKNIQIKLKNSDSTWSNLFPKTLASLSILDNGKSLETAIAEILTALGSKVGLSDVTTEIQKVVGTAPAALNTLQELASALNNDANFAATITNALSKKVDIVTGKQLTTEDFTTALKNKLAGIADGATNYVHPTGDGNLHVPATSTTNAGKLLKAGATAGSMTWSTITISDITGLQASLDSKSNASDVYTKTEVDNKLTGVVTSGNVYTKAEVDTKLTTKARVIVSPTEDTTADFWFQEI